MFENPNSWLTLADFFGDAYTLHDGDSFDNQLNNMCVECQQYECQQYGCQNQYYQQPKVIDSNQIQTNLTIEKMPLEFADSLPANTPNNKNIEMHERVIPKQKTQTSIFNNGGCVENNSGCECEKLENPVCGVLQQYHDHDQSYLVQQSQNFARATNASAQQYDFTLPHVSNLSLEAELGSVTLYPSRFYPALEAVPGITYPLEENSYENVYKQHQILHTQKQQQQQILKNQYLPSCQMALTQQTHHSLPQNQWKQNSSPSEAVAHPLCNTKSTLAPLSHVPAHHSVGGVQNLLGRPPCRGNAPWSYSYCYGDERNNYQPCHFIECTDIEDFLNNEKRKEKSRDAARCRRSRETEIFCELAQILPLRKEDVNQLDKASVMRIAIAFLKIREMLKMIPQVQDIVEDLKLNIDTDDNSNQISTDATTENPKEKFDLVKSADANQFIKQTLDGFMIILTNDGDITYVSDNITDYLGLAKIDVIGQQVWEYSHQCDHSELKDALNIKRTVLSDKIKDKKIVDEELSTDHRDLFVRFKCTLTSRGRSINIKSASYKVIHITGHLVANEKGDRVLVAIGRPIPHPSNIEIPLGSTTFFTKHSLDMKFIYADEKMKNLLGYNNKDLLETSLFDYHHGGDSDGLMTTFKTVLNKGQGETCSYRFLGKYGGYCWIVTQATIVYDKLKPQSVVCVNYVISNLEHNNEIYSLAQYEASKLKIEECCKIDESYTSASASHHNNINNNKDNNNTNVIKQNANKIDTRSIDDDKFILKECYNTIEHKTEKQQQQQQQVKLYETNKSSAIPQQLTATSDDDPNEDRSDSFNNNNNNNNILNNKNLCANIKHEQTPPPPPPPIINEPFATSTTPTQQHIRFVKSIDGNKSNLRENSLSPLRRNLQENCLIGNNNIAINNKNPFLPKSLEQKRPKSVTASVFRPATSAAELNVGTSGVTNANALSSLSGAAPRAQSVTASVFTPISQLCNKQLQQQQQQHQNQENSKTKSIATTAILSGQQQKTAKAQTTTIIQQQQQQLDMNKFLSFGDDATELTMLKEEPDDLAHLAPATADECMRLDESAPFCGEMLLGLCSYNYGSFLPDDYSSLDSTTNSSSPDSPNRADNQNNTNNEFHQQTCNNILNTATNDHNSNGNNNCMKPVTRIDPFINYREESNDTNYSQHLLSPRMTSKSPEASSLPSLCSPNSLSQDDGFAFMTMSVDEDIDMTMRAPYIPMNEQEDLPLLTADDLMWCANNGLGSEELSNQKDIDATLKQLQAQQQKSSEDNKNSFGGFHDVQHNTIHQSQFNSLCSSPASTASSLSPSPLHQHQQQQQQHEQLQQQQQQQQQLDTNCVYNTDTRELAALLCGSGNGALSILNNNCSSTIGGAGVVNGGAENFNNALQQQTQQQSNCVEGDGDFLLQDSASKQQQQQQQQQRQMQLLTFNTDCKKESSLSPSLCDSIEDTFDNVYSKDSTNIDCWNELLQINVGQTTSTPTASTARTLNSVQQQKKLSLQQQQHHELQQQTHDQQPQQHNIILNAVPLITIQNTKNILLQQQQQPQHDIGNKIIINDEMLPVNRGGNKITTIKLVDARGNTKTTTAAEAVTSLAVAQLTGESSGANNLLRTADANTKPQQQQKPQLLQFKQQQQQQQVQLQQINQSTQQQQPQQQSHKRPLVTNSQQRDNKRMKSVASAGAADILDVNMELNEMPQLLQQLVMPTPQLNETMTTQPQPQQQQQQQMRKTSTKNVWLTPGHNKMANGIMQQQQQQSNSVLKNLLISGCDTSNYANDEEILLNKKNLQQKISSESPELTSQLHCQTAPSAVLLSYHHNPMIGGPCELPSPPFSSNSSGSKSDCIDSNDSDKLYPIVLTPTDTESNSDSGIDDINMMETDMPRKLQFDNSRGPLFKLALPTTTANKDKLLLKYSNSREGKKRAANDQLAFEPQRKQQQQQQQPLSLVNSAAINEYCAVANSNGSVDTTKNGNKSNCFPKDSMPMNVDNINPLMEPFIMDLCNDNYDVATEDLLEANEINQVLSGWTNEIV